MTTLEQIERTITDLGEGTPEYHEALAYYFLILARTQWRRADLARQVDSVKRQAAARKRS